MTSAVQIIKIREINIIEKWKVGGRIEKQKIELSCTTGVEGEEGNKEFRFISLINCNGEIDRLENNANIGKHEVMIFDRTGDGI